MKKVWFVITVICLFCSADLMAQADTRENEFSMGVQIRPRAEYRNGVLNPRFIGDDPALFVNNRTRLSMDFKRDRLSLGFAAQHVGVWGQQPQIETKGDVMINEAWANLDLGYGLFMKFGRQSLIYDDERILGGLDWNISGRFHDALKVGYEDDQNRLHLILAFNQMTQREIGGTFFPEGGQLYKSMQTAWYQHLWSPEFKSSFLIMNLGQEAGTEEAADTKFMQTYGTNLNYARDGLQVNGTFYYQSGKTKTDQTISAFMWSVNGGYQICPTWRVTAGLDFLSGADSGSDKYKAFNPLYGTHHKFYGAMDYFYASSFQDGYNPGLWDTQLGLAYKASPAVTLSLNYHYFATAATVYDEDAKQGKGLGSEFDFQVDWNIMKDVRLSAGYSTMFGTATMQVVKGGNPSHWQDWGWVSINVNPKVFIAKW